MASDAKKQTVSNDRLANERKKRQWTQSDLASELYSLCDEEELAEHGTIDGNMVSKWERGLHTPGFFWQRKLRELFGLDAGALGFVDHLETKVSGIPQESSPIQSTKNANADECQPIQIILPNSSPYIITVHVYQQAKLSTSNPPKEDGILATRMVNALGQEHLSERENTVNRRDFNRKALGVAAGAFASPDDLLNTELLDRFHRALKKPSTIDGRFLDYLEIRTANYWQDRHGAALASSDLLSYVVEHFEKILRLLEGPMSPTERIRLCSIASKTSLLIGELLLDMSYYARAREFQRSALTAAQETNNQALEAISWGRLSLAWTYSKNAPNALACVQEARHLAAESSTSLVNAWLAAIESEAQVNLHHWDACLKALDAAEHIEDQQDSPEDNYLIHFDRSLLGGYQGVCFRRLYRPDDTQSSIYLEKAQNVLMNSLTHLDPALVQRKPTFLTDLADTCIQQGEIEEACERAIQAASIAAKIKLQKVVQRLFTLREELEPWKETQYVKHLDNHLAPLTISGG